MKTLINFLQIALFLVITTVTQAQTPWILEGNSTITPGTDILGTTDDTPIPFYTDDEFRMILTEDGDLGLNEFTPTTLFHMTDGGFLVEGDGGPFPATLGTGTYFYWDQVRSAFRAGEFLTGQIGSGVGSFSWAGGEDCEASGAHSFSYGYRNEASGTNSISLGQQNESLGLSSVTLGYQNTTSTSQYTVGIGYKNDVAGFSSVAIGDNNVASASDSFVFGEECRSTAGSSMAMGRKCEANGNFSFAVGDSCVADEICSLALGWYNFVSGDNSSAIGYEVDIASDAKYAYGMGANLISSADSNLVLGMGMSTSNRIQNNIAHSMMAGFNSDVPTFFMSGGDGTQNSIGRVGIGNILSPTERLDVNGTARLRVMPNDTPPDALITGIEESEEGDYTLNYFTFNGDDESFLGGDGTWVDISSFEDCDWQTNGTNVWTGLTSGCLPTGNVGIGTATPTAKFHLLDPTTTNLNSAWLQSSGANANTTHSGLFSIDTGVSDRNHGVWGYGYRFTTNVDDDDYFGVRGTVYSECDDAAGAYYGVYGEVLGGASPTCADAWAGYFVGLVYSSLGYDEPSDENLKENIQPLSGALETVMELAPKTYDFKNDEFDYLNLPETSQYGLIAQEVQEVLPEIVSNVHHPAQFDQEGNVTSEATDFLAMKPNQLIPIMLGAIQEQQGIIESQNQRIDDLFAAVEVCCSVQDTGDLLSGELEVDITVVPGDKLDQNIPNPFNNITTIGYKLSCDCRATIRVYNSTGKLIATLLDSVHDAGSHSVDWNSGSVEAGVYFYSLEVNGQELVRRAIKL
jgi:hypothetical protein